MQNLIEHTPWYTFSSMLISVFIIHRCLWSVLALYSIFNDDTQAPLTRISEGWEGWSWWPWTLLALCNMIILYITDLLQCSLTRILQGWSWWPWTFFALCNMIILPLQCPTGFLNRLLKDLLVFKSLFSGFRAWIFTCTFSPKNRRKKCIFCFFLRP